MDYCINSTQVKKSSKKISYDLGGSVSENNSQAGEQFDSKLPVKPSTVQIVCKVLKGEGILVS